MFIGIIEKPMAIFLRSTMRIRNKIPRQRAVMKVDNQVSFQISFSYTRDKNSTSISMK